MESLREPFPEYCWDFPYDLKLAIRHRSDGEVVLRIKTAVSCLPQNVHLGDRSLIRHDCAQRRSQLAPRTIGRHRAFLYFGYLVFHAVLRVLGRNRPVTSARNALRV